MMDKCSISEQDHVYVICPCCSGAGAPDCQLCDGSGKVYNIDALEWMDCQ